MNTSIVKNIYTSSLQHPELNILIIPYDGLYEYMLAEAFPQHKFYILQSKVLWPQSINEAKSLKNVIYLTDDRQVFNQQIHGVICNDRFASYDIGKQYSDILHIPLIQVDHINIYNNPFVRKEDAILIKKQKPVDVCVNIDGTKEDFIIPYGFNICSTFHQNHVLVYTNNEEELTGIRNTCTTLSINSLQQFMIQLKLCGHFLYFTNDIGSKLPILYALSRGCNVFTNIDFPQTNKITLPELSYKISKILDISNTSNIAYIQEKYPLNKFVDGWNKIFNTLHLMIHKR